MSNPQDSEAASGAGGHFDVLVVGAGISGIGAGCHLQMQMPGTSFVILESKESFGGTWITHKYPGIRSDSDLYTFGYRFKPWTGPPIATAEEILRYMGEVIDEHGLAPHIRYRHRIRSASWSSEDKRWTVEAERLDSGQTLRFTASFLWMCQGYYRHDEGYTPEWKDMERFAGRIVHPQTWPEDLELKDKRVLVIGSGATAATLVPAIAGEVQHVTMLQRSPTYFIPAPNQNDLANILREIEIDDALVHDIVRKKILHDQKVLTRRCIDEPEVVKQELLEGVRAFVGSEEVEKSFTPSYRPWRQRVAYVPDGDLFQGIVAGKADVVTGEIERFTAKGVLLKSGRELEADVIVTATGFHLCVLGDVRFTVDGKPVDFADTVTWRGMMFTGVPNMVWIFGYFRASWTLRVDLVCDLVVRMLKRMKEKGLRVVLPRLRPGEQAEPRLDWIDPDNFNPNYLLRSMHLMPRRLDKPEWQHTQDYWRENEELPRVDLDDETLAWS